MSLMPASFSRTLRLFACDSAATEITRGRQRFACSKARSRLRPSASVTTWNRSGKDSTTLRVLRPIEPVDPKIAMRFMDTRMLLDGRGGRAFHKQLAELSDRFKAAVEVWKSRFFTSKRYQGPAQETLAIH